MKNKILIIGIIVITLVIVLVFNVIKNNNMESSIAKEFYNQYKEDVDDGSESFRDSETFNKMNEANQIEEMKNLLKIYEKNKIIKNLHYDDSSKMFTFVYNYGEIKGALGGVSLKIWDPMMN